MRNYKIASIFVALFSVCVQAEPDSPQSESASGIVDEEISFGTAASIRNQFEEDTQTKDHWIKVDAIDHLFQPWTEFRRSLADEHGFRPNISATHVYQKAQEVIGLEDDVAGYELVVDGTWTFFGRNTGNAATAGFEFLYRDFSSEIPPVALFTQVGSLYPTTVAFSEVDPTVGQFWVQKKDAKVAEAWGVVVSGYQKFGRYLPFARYGYADSDEEPGLGDAVPIEHMVNVGMAIDALFGKANDRLGIGATWSRPIDDSLDDQRGT